VKRRLITRAGANKSQTLLLASSAELEQKIVEQYESIQNFSATFDMTPALGTTEKSQITEYKDVRGFIVFRKPADIRIIGLYPVVRNTAFDMVSDGSDFKLYVPARNRFLIGRNEIDRPSPNKLENLRPRPFLEALLVQPLGTGNGAFWRTTPMRTTPSYSFTWCEAGAASWVERTVWFSCLDPRPCQITLDPRATS
jgi:outer membrane lipoprotein-sorting protein